MTATLLTAGNQTGLTSGVGIATASVSPTDDALVLVHVTYSRTGSTTPTASTSVAGAGLTFATVNALAYDATGLSRGLQELWRAQGNASAGAITITPSYTDASGSITWQVIEVPAALIGNNGADAIIQGVGDAAGETDDTLAVTLAAFAAATNHTLGFAAVRLTTGSITAGAGFTLLDEEAAGTNTRGLAEWRATADTSPDFTTTAGIGVNGRRMYAIEVGMLPLPQTATGNPSVINVVGRRGRASIDDPAVDNFRRPRRTLVWVHGYNGVRRNVVS